jgi:hypothetical protein
VDRDFLDVCVAALVFAIFASGTASSKLRGSQCEHFQCRSGRRAGRSAFGAALFGSSPVQQLSGRLYRENFVSLTTLPFLWNVRHTPTCLPRSNEPLRMTLPSRRKNFHGPCILPSRFAPRYRTLPLSYRSIAGTGFVATPKSCWMCGSRRRTVRCCPRAHARRKRRRPLSRLRSLKTDRADIARTLRLRRGPEIDRSFEGIVVAKRQRHQRRFLRSWPTVRFENCPGTVYTAASLCGYWPLMAQSSSSSSKSRQAAMSTPWFSGDASVHQCGTCVPSARRPPASSAAATLASA